MKWQRESSEAMNAVQELHHFQQKQQKNKVQGREVHSRGCEGNGGGGGGGVEW